ncbi:MAG: ferritin [Clostridiales bacterium]|nr:ferritin [Clostridiales bacterium]
MLHPDVKKLLVEQINKELYSAYLYLSIANYYADQNLNGFENWFYVQAQEERDHAMIIRTYLIDNGEPIAMGAIAEPKNAFSSFGEPLNDALAHEQYVTASIHSIYSAAAERKDYRTMQFLDWFIREQGEEEKNADDLIKRFALFGGDAKSLYMLNAELAARVYTPSTLATT